MRTVLFSADAIQSLDSIWDYTETQWGADQADAYDRALQAAIQSLADGEITGTAINELRTGYRVLHVERHTIYFRISESTIEIMHILHQSMDVDKHL